jgi:hypothetical protein
MATPYLGEHVAPGDNLRFYPKLEKIPVLGLDTPVANCAELAKCMADKWVRPEDKPIEDVEAEFRALYQRLIKDHPRAVFATFRYGQKVYDPTAPEKEYTGWDCTGTSAHGPNAVHLEALRSLAGADWMEVTFRGRPAMMRLDFSSIPNGSEILAAQLVLLRAGELAKDWDTRRPYFVAEFCNRPWKEAEVNTFEYAKDQEGLRLRCLEDGAERVHGSSCRRIAGHQDQGQFGASRLGKDGARRLGSSDGTCRRWENERTTGHAARQRTDGRLLSLGRAPALVKSAAGGWPRQLVAFRPSQTDKRRL